MEKLFHLKQNGTTVRTEVIAGLTTFMTMAYIIALNPNLLTNFGEKGQDLWNGVFLATCIASAIGTLCMAFLANKPFVMAPGMGLNSFFALVAANIAMMTGMTYLESFQSALVIIFIEGIIFILLSLFNVREKIVQAIPLVVRLGIGPAIGLMLMNIGFGSNAGVFVFNDGILNFTDNGCTPEELWQNHSEKYVDIRPVGIMKSKVVTARLIIPEWSLEGELHFDETQLNKSEVWLAMTNAGLRYGIGTYRACYGRYSVTEIK